MSMKAQYGQPKDNYHTKIMLKSTGIFIVCLILTLICLIPIYILIVNATHDSMDLVKDPSQFWFGSNLKDNIDTMLGKAVGKNGKLTAAARSYSTAFNMLVGYKNSLIIAGCTTILTVFFSAMTAYGLTVYDYRLKGPAYTVIIGVMMIPVQVTSAGFISFMYDLGLVDSYIPLIVPAVAAPAVVFFMVSYMKSSFPFDIVEASRIDGCGEFRTFLTIALPMMKPAIAVQAIFAFVANWNNYYTQNMIIKSAGNKTIPIMVQAVLGLDRNQDYGVNYLCITMSILPIVIVYFILSKFIIAGVALGGVKE